MTAVTSAIKPEQQPSFCLLSFCLFPPVAKSVRSSLLRFKLKRQFDRQSRLVPPTPISSYQAVNGQITHLAVSYIQGVLFTEMCERGHIVDDPGILSKKTNGGKVNYYYLEAAKYAGRISAGNFDGENAKYKPIFEIHYNDFTPRLQGELQSLLKDSPSTLASVVENAVFRIFKARHKLIFYNYIEHEGLNWRFVAD